MIRRLALSLLALSALVLHAPSAHALPGLGDILDGIGDVLPDPCDLIPGLCDDPPPPPEDPCVLNPRLCGPVIDLCDIAPFACDGGLPPIAQPEDPPAPTFDHAADLAGSAKIRGGDFQADQPFTVLLNFDASTFLAATGEGHVYSGHLSPKGTKGTKFQLFLDAGSEDALSAEVGGRAADASGRAAGNVLGTTSKLVLKLRPDGTGSLKIKANVLFQGVGEVVFKANLTGPVDSDI